MDLIVVFDSNPFDTRLEMGWGFAAWVEYGGRTVLFDTGADSAAGAMGDAYSRTCGLSNPAA